MPRCSILFASERESLLALPDTEDERIRHSTFNASDLAIIRERRSPANCLGLAVQLCLIRDRSFEQQHSRASGLNLVTAVIVLWNIFYLEREANVFVVMARPSMTTCCNTCRRWTGNTST